MARCILLIFDGRIAFGGGFAELRSELGCTKRAAVSFADGKLKEIDYQDTNKLLRELFMMEGISDVAFTQTSLEEGLANLNAKWSVQ